MRSKQHLRKKGWSAKEISKAEKIIEKRHKSDKSKTKPYINRLIYWTVIFVIIIGNLMVSMLLVPFLIVLDKIALDFAIIILGLGFGALFTILVQSVEYIERKHHLLAAIIIPVSALINIFAVVWMANTLNDLFRFTNLRANPYIIGLMYVVAFVLPYIISLFRSQEEA